MKPKTIITLLAGIWSFGIGFRLSLELFDLSGYIAIPCHPINLYFDFIPLMLLGISLIYFSYLDYIKELRGETGDV